jgi:hypothetical protein
MPSMSISEVAILSRLHRLGKGARENPRDSLRFYEFRVWESVEMVACWLGSIIQNKLSTATCTLKGDHNYMWQR